MAKLDMRLLAERLEERMRTMALTQTTLAERAELNLGNVNEVLKQRKTSVRADTIVSLAEALQCSADYLLGLTDDPRPRRRRQASMDGESQFMPAALVLVGA